MYCCICDKQCCVHAWLRAVYRLAEKVMILDKGTHMKQKTEKDRVREPMGRRRGGGSHRESRCICNFAVGCAYVLRWRPTWTAECKMRKNRSLGKGDRTETRSGKKLNPRDFIGALSTATVSFWRVIPVDTNGNQEFANAVGSQQQQQQQKHGCYCKRQWNIYKSALGC